MGHEASPLAGAEANLSARLWFLRWGWLERFGPRLVTGRADQLEKIMSASNNLATFADEVPHYTEALARKAVL